MRKIKPPRMITCKHCGKETPVIKHGTLTAYIHHGCRCDPCRDAVRENRALTRVYKTGRKNRYVREDPLW